MIIDNSNRSMEVNVFMGLGEITEYALVALNRYESVVKVLYYRAESDEDITIDFNKVEVVKSFTCSSEEEAERKYDELNDMSIVIPIIMEYLQRQIQ